MDIQAVHPTALTADDVALWSRLQAADPALDSPFLAPQWARAVARAQEKTGDEAIRVAVIRENGAPVGFLPARIDGRTAIPVGAPMCDYQGVIAAPQARFEARELVAGLGVDRLDFDHMLEHQAAFAAHARGRDTSWVIDVAAGYQAYEAERRAAGVGALKDLDKKRRKVEREVAACQFSAFSRSRSDFDQLIAWKRQQHRATGQTDVLGVGWTARLVDELFESRDPDWGGVMFTLHLGERLAAAHFHLRGARTIHGWLIGHDAEFERYSPGLLLFQDILRWMDGSPYARLDLGAGDYRFKRELSNTQIGVTHGFVGRPSASSLVRQTFYGVRAAAEALPLGRFSQLPGKAMRRLDIERALRA